MRSIIQPDDWFSSDRLDRWTIRKLHGSSNGTRAKMEILKSKSRRIRCTNRSTPNKRTKRNKIWQEQEPRDFTAHLVYTFALHLFVEAGWPGLGLVLVPLTLRLARRLLSGFVRLASRDPPLLLVFLVRRPLRGVRPLSLPPTRPSQRAHFAFPPPCSSVPTVALHPSPRRFVLPSSRRYLSIVLSIRRSEENSKAERKRERMVQFRNERTKVNCTEESHRRAVNRCIKKGLGRGELEP